MKHLGKYATNRRAFAKLFRFLPNAAKEFANRNKELNPLLASSNLTLAEFKRAPLAS